MRNLKLEVFSSNNTIENTKFHVYKLLSSDINNNRYKIIRSACQTIRNFNSCGVFEDGNNIYTTKKIEIKNENFSIEYLGEYELDVLKYKRVYKSAIEYYIKKNLQKIFVKQKYRKYSIKPDILSKWIKINDDYTIIRSEKITFERKYKIRIEIDDNRKAYLWLLTSGVYTSNKNIFDYINSKTNVIDLKVKSEWGNQSGDIIRISDKTVSDILDFGTSLKDYYTTKTNLAKFIKNAPDNSPVVEVKTNSGKILSFYPQALKPIITREVLLKLDPKLSKEIDKHTKLNMHDRFQIDKDFIADIGVIEELSNLSFHNECCTVDKIGFETAEINSPKFICANNQDLKSKYSVFTQGFYKIPDKPLNLAYFYPKHDKGRDLIQAIAYEIYDFCNGLKKYAPNKILPIGKAKLIEEYDINDKTDYKEKALSLSKQSDIDIAFVIVPDGKDENIDSPYNPFKRIWAEIGIPSQMVSISTAEKFITNKDKMQYHMFNIVLGILGKTGGIPWIIKNMPSDVDCFVGLDVGTIEKGIHIPSSSVVFDKFGKLLKYYRPKQPQKGEIISTEILEDIFDNVIIAYKNEYGHKPKHIVIHRDGFNNESAQWYEAYFKKHDIEYTIIEIRKNIDIKMLLEQNGKILNPQQNQCIYNQNKGYIITTNIKDSIASPNPILVEKICGKLDIKEILTQVLYLSQLHIGSTKELRLPITTGYADKLCKCRDLIPVGLMDNRLFFL